MDCPVCLKQMDKLDLVNTEVDTCRFCGGVWLDGKELGAFVQKGKIPKRILSSYALDDGHQKVGEGDRECPRCRTKLKLISHKGVTVDFCGECSGFWFDRGELKIIMEKYADEMKGKKIKPLQSRIVQEFDEDGDEIIRIDDEGMFEHQDANREQQESEEMAADPLAKELLSAGSKGEIVKALPKSITDGKEPLPYGGLAAPGMSSGTKLSPLGMPMGLSSDMGRYQGHHGAGNLFFDCLAGFLKAIFTARKY